MYLPFGNPEKSHVPKLQCRKFCNFRKEKPSRNLKTDLILSVVLAKKFKIHKNCEASIQSDDFYVFGIQELLNNSATSCNKLSLFFRYVSQVSL